MITRQVLGDRHKNDGRPLRRLNKLQEETIKKYLGDERICCTPVRECPLCSSQEFAVVAEKDQFGIPLDTGICKGCGLILSLAQLTADSAAIFYDEYYRKIYEGVVGPTLTHGYYMKLYESESSVPRVPAFITDKSLVLEIGCGGGWNLLPYKKRGIMHIGLDYDRAMVAYGRERYCLDLYEGGIETAVTKGVKADYVILSHVLEHVANPVTFLETLSRVMKRGGIVRISVPCVDYVKYFGGSGTSYDFGLNLQNAHNYTFSERTLRAVLAKSGYMPVVLIGGFCLARYVGQEKSVCDTQSEDATYWQDVAGMLITSEKNRRAKSALVSMFPKKMRFIFSYMHYAFHPIALLKYAFLMNGRFGYR